VTDLDDGGHGSVVSITILSLACSLWSMVYDRSRSVVLVQFEIGGPGSGLLSHDLGLILVVDLALEVCHRSDLGVFGFLGFSWLWICGVSVVGVFLAVGLWVW
jgi:hypothetical protein